MKGDADMLSDHARLELRAAVRRYHVVVLVAYLALSVVTSFLLPSMPPAIYRFFEKVCGLRNWTEMILFNDYMGLFVVVFWTGVVDLTRVYVIPLEEGYLGLLLAKPITRSRYLFRKVLPIFAVTAGIGIAITLFFPLKIALVNGTADLDVAGTLCAGLVSLALAIGCLAIMNLVFLYTRETYHATLLSFVLFSAAVLPGALYIYRPDLFAGRAALRDVLVYPANVVWLAGALPAMTPAILASTVIVCAVLLVAAARRLARVDTG